MSCYGSDNRAPQERWPWWISHVWQDLVEALPFHTLDFSTVPCQRFGFPSPRFISHCLLKDFVSSLLFPSYWRGQATCLYRWGWTITQSPKSAATPMATSKNQANFTKLISGKITRWATKTSPHLLASSQGDRPWRNCMWGWGLLSSKSELEKHPKLSFALLQVVHVITTVLCSFLLTSSELPAPKQHQSA